MYSKQRDNLYAHQHDSVGGFVFDEKVAQVFGDMITRSVPGYAAIVSMIGMLSEQYAQDDTVCYDLGCSLGAVTAVMRERLEGRNCRIVAIDNSEAMIVKCRQNLAGRQSAIPVDVQCADVQDVAIQNASFVVLNFVLQFLSPDNRTALLKHICNGMCPGGALVLSEKIDFIDGDESQFQIALHHTFKKLQGYSDLEISQKRTALENVLIPDTLAVHRERLLAAGFQKVFVWFQCFNFISLVAIK